MRVDVDVGVDARSVTEQTLFVHVEALHNGQYSSCACVNLQFAHSCPLQHGDAWRVTSIIRNKIY